MADETNSNLTPEQMAARIAELEGRLAKGSSLSFKVSEKGGVSVYGLGRFPVTRIGLQEPGDRRCVARNANLKIQPA
jgi:hypothetical protein